MDKVNIVSSQDVLKVSSFSTDTRSKSSSPLVNSLVKNRLFKTAPSMSRRFNPSTLWICYSRCHMTAQISNLQDCDLGCLWPYVGRKNVWRFLTQQFNCCTCAARCAVHCPAGTKSLPSDTLRIAGSSMTSL